MSNAFVTPTLISKEAPRIFQNNMVLLGACYRKFEPQFVNEKTGGTIQVRLPNRFRVSQGVVLDVQDVTEVSVPVSINLRRHVDIPVTSQDFTVSLENFSERILNPAMLALRNEMEATIAQVAGLSIPNLVGTPGSGGLVYDDGLAGKALLNKLGIPLEKRVCVVDPDSENTLAKSLKGVFQPMLVKEIVEEARIGRAGATDYFMSQNIANFTSGVNTTTGTRQVNTAQGATRTSTLLTKGWSLSTTKILAKGQIITIAGVNSLNSLAPFADTGTLRQFVVTADVNSDGGGLASVPIYPSLDATTVSGSPSPQATVSAVAADNATITVVGAHKMNLMFCPDTIAVVCVPLSIPDGAKWAVKTQFKGMWMRIIKVYDKDIDSDVMRCDVFYGVTVPRGESGCRIAA